MWINGALHIEFVLGMGNPRSGSEYNDTTYLIKFSV